MSKAMVVDDSKVIRMILAKTLSNFGFQVCQAGDGQEALDAVEREQEDFSVILVDWNMPVMNGLEFVKRFRANPERAGVPVMMVTTETEMDQMLLALEAGANEYVMKPFTPEMIVDKLRIIGAIQ